MKKLKTILKIAAVILSAAVFVLFAVSAAKIYRGRKTVESLTGSSVSYFSDESILSRDYYKYKDENETQYWVDTSSGSFVYLYDKNAAELTTSNSQSAALELAYEAARQFGSGLFSMNTTWVAVDNSYYIFYIMQLDEQNLKTGRFIEIKVNSNQIEYLAVHEDISDGQFSSCISEDEAISIAYSQSQLSEFALYAEDSHLVKTDFYKRGDIWVWDVSIWEITADEIQAQNETIDTEVFFNCQINAHTSKAAASQWIKELTDYCPLTGEILAGD